jgi:hypothetical protein
LGAGSTALAQAPQPPRAPQPQDQAQTQPDVDVSKLPLDLDRIERQLRRSQQREEFEDMRLRAFVDVFGRAPAIRFFTPGENLSTGPVPWGAPTHQEMLNQMTPQEFRTPPADFSNLIRWLTEKMNK